MITNMHTSSFSSCDGLGLLACFCFRINLKNMTLTDNCWESLNWGSDSRKAARARETQEKVDVHIWLYWQRSLNVIKHRQLFIKLLARKTDNWIHEQDDDTPVSSYTDYCLSMSCLEQGTLTDETSCVFSDISGTAWSC